jgi:hypothetical protein
LPLERREDVRHVDEIPSNDREALSHAIEEVLTRHGGASDAVNEEIGGRRREVDESIEGG